MGHKLTLTNKECANLLEQLARTLSEPMRTQAIQACDRLRYTADEEPKARTVARRLLGLPARFSVYNSAGKRVLVSVPED
jgi:hypothetical protein